MDMNKYTENALAVAESMLNEIAMSIEDFKDKIIHLQFQLVENWCLCKWCQLFALENDNFNHWQAEFKAYATALQKAKLKSGDKHKILAKEFIENYDYNDPSQILDIIQEKFDEEGIADERQREAVALEFSRGIFKLIDVICSATPISTYIREEFNLDGQEA
jgi:hypothetical protein